jgi:hypothetical protein
LETHIVISRFNEPIDWVHNLKYPYTIYNKGKNDIDLPNIKLPNIGRESGSYIYHITQHYSNLPDYLILLQANPFEHCRKIYDRIDSFDLEKITLLTDSELPNDLYKVPQDHQDGVKLIVDKLGLYGYLKNYDSPQYNYSFGSQWVVPKKYIINKSLKFWVDLYEVHQNMFISAWVLERMFLYIFNHSDIIKKPLI